MVELDREPRQGVVAKGRRRRSDETPLPRRGGVSRSRLDRGKAGKIRGIGAGEGSDRDPNPSKPRRQPAKDLDPRSGRVRRAMIAANSKAASAAFVCSFPAGHREAQNDADAGWPRVLSTHPFRASRRSARSPPHRRQDGGPHCLGGDLSGSFASMQRCRLGSDHGRRRKPVAKLKEFVFRDHRRFPRDVSLEARLGRAAHLAAHAAAHDAPARPWDIVQRDTRCKSAPSKGAAPLGRAPHRGATARGMRQDGAAVARCGGRDHPIRPAPPRHIDDPEATG